MVKRSFFFFLTILMVGISNFLPVKVQADQLAERILRRYLVSRSEEAGVGAWDVFERQRDQSLQFLTSLGETKYQRFVERYVAPRSGETPEEIQARLQNQPIYKSDLVDFAPVGVGDLKDDPMIMRVTVGAKGELNQVRLFDSEQNKIVLDFTTELSIDDRDKVQFGEQPGILIPRDERFIKLKKKKLFAEELELREKPPVGELCRDPADPTCQVPPEICADPADPACRVPPAEICADPADPGCSPEACRDHWSIWSTQVGEICGDPITIYERNCLGEERVTELPPFQPGYCDPFLPPIINGKRCGNTIDRFDNARVYSIEGVTAINGGEGETYVSPSESCRDDHFIVGRIRRIPIPEDGWVDIGRDSWRDGRGLFGFPFNDFTGRGQSPCIFFRVTTTATREVTSVEVFAFRPGSLGLARDVGKDVTTSFSLVGGGFFFGQLLVARFPAFPNTDPGETNFILVPGFGLRGLSGNIIGDRGPFIGNDRAQVKAVFDSFGFIISESSIDFIFEVLQFLRTFPGSEILDFEGTKRVEGTETETFEEISIFKLAPTGLFKITNGTATRVPGVSFRFNLGVPPATSSPLSSGESVAE